MLDVDDGYTLGSDKETGTGIWYELDSSTGSATKVTNNKVSFNEIGVHTKTYVTTENGQTVVYTYKFYVTDKYSDSHDKDEEYVVLTESSSFVLSKLYDGSNYKFYKVSGDFGSGQSPTSIDEIVMENSFTTVANDQTNCNYIVYDGEKYFKLTVTYMFVSSTKPTEKSLIVASGDELAKTILTDVQADQTLSNDWSFTTVYTNNNGILTEVGGETITADNGYRVAAQDYVIVAKKTVDNVTTYRYYRYTYTFYVCSAGGNGEEVEIETAANAEYSLADANTNVISQLGLTGDCSVVYYTFDGTKLAEAGRTIDLSLLSEGKSVEKQYFIAITKDGTTTYYYAKLTFKPKTATAES
jgi:hypothetical protein